MAPKKDAKPDPKATKGPAPGAPKGSPPPPRYKEGEVSTCYQAVNLKNFNNILFF